MDDSIDEFCVKMPLSTTIKIQGHRGCRLGLDSEDEGKEEIKKLVRTTRMSSKRGKALLRARLRRSS